MFHDDMLIYILFNFRNGNIKALMHTITTATCQLFWDYNCWMDQTREEKKGEEMFMNPVIHHGVFFSHMCGGWGVGGRRLRINVTQFCDFVMLIRSNFALRIWYRAMLMSDETFSHLWTCVCVFDRLQHTLRLLKVFLIRFHSNAKRA